jgi:hypothetical protein
MKWLNCIMDSNLLFGSFPMNNIKKMMKMIKHALKKTGLLTTLLIAMLIS